MVSEFSQLSYDQSIPPLVLLIFFIIVIPASKFIATLIEAAKPGYFDLDLKVDENLSNYFEALEESDKTWMVQEEENLRKNYVSVNNIPLIMSILTNDN